MASTREGEESIPSLARVLLGALATLLVVGEMGIGGVWDLLRIPYARETATRLGYPTYVLVMLGACKLAASLALMVPGFRVVKEWAYAGAFIAYAVTAISHLAVGDDLGSAWAPCVFAALVLVSRMLRAPVSDGSAHSTTAGGRAVAYWLTTSLVVAACLLAGIWWSSLA